MRITKALALGTAAVLAALLLAGPLTAAAQESSTSDEADCLARAGASNVNIRREPRSDVPNVIGSLRSGQALPVVARSAEGDWYAVAYMVPTGYQAPQAWVAAHVVRVEGACRELRPLLEKPDSADMMLLAEVPVLPTLDVERLREVFERGQTLGNKPHAFTKAGDCNTDTQYFMMALDWDDYELGAYGELQPSVEFFSGSFEHVSLAGQVGYNTTHLLDPLFVNPAVCTPGAEGLLACEYRRQQPSVAVMMFGPNDMLNLSEEQFEAALTEIVELSLERGVIPVLTTFTWHQDWLWEKMLRFNVITVEIAEAYGVPLVNFWRAALDLPNLGLVTNYTHLTESGFASPHYYRIAFDGPETHSGYALRNLLTLQTLDALRREVLDVEPAAP